MKSLKEIDKKFDLIWKKQDNFQKVGIIIVACLIFAIIVYSASVAIISYSVKDEAIVACNHKVSGDVVNAIVERNGYFNNDVPKGYLMLVCDYIVDETRYRNTFYIKEK